MEWGPAITGAFCAVAVAIVLGLFGRAFGAGGLVVLSGIWEVVTPLVATFIGALIAATMSERRHAYPSAIMVWCLSLVAGALLVADVGALQGARGGEGVAGDPGLLALAGLAAILGLLGAGVGAALGVSASSRRAAGRSSTGTFAGPRERVAGGDHHTIEEQRGAGVRAPAPEDPRPPAH